MGKWIDSKDPKNKSFAISLGLTEERGKEISDYILELDQDEHYGMVESLLVMQPKCNTLEELVFTAIKVGQLLGIKDSAHAMAGPLKNLLEKLADHIQDEEE